MFNGASTENDSTSYPSSTGIEFIKNDNISIESESLFLAERTVEVDYEFYNHASKEVSVHMAFPLPEIDITNKISTDGGNPETWKFLVYVNNKKIENITVQWRAIVNNVDKALILQKLGIQIGSPSLREEDYESNVGRITTTCLNHTLNKENQDMLISEGLANKEEELETCLVPQWKAQATYLWEANFAPHKITKVKHRYNQWPGLAQCGPQNNTSQPHGCEIYSKEYSEVAKRLGEVPVDLHFYNYVLHTGGNWKGPIKTFKFRAQGPRESWSWVEAPFLLKRASANTLTANIYNYKPLSKSEYQEALKEKSESPLLRIEKGEIRFFYATKHKE